MDSITPIMIVPYGQADYPVEDCEAVMQALANRTKKPVHIAIVDKPTHEKFSDQISHLPFSHLLGKPLRVVEPASAKPMSAAEFVWLEDGRPDWGAMWNGFCELALYGGPPHRGVESALTHPEGFGMAQADFDAIAEIKRGIMETTGLTAEIDEPGWIMIQCDSKMMAAWLCATIIIENVEARCDGDRLYLPASWEFGLKNEVKSVITVLAKTNHYWEAHVAKNNLVPVAE